MFLSSLLLVFAARQICSEMYSMNETKAIDLLKQHAKRFVKHNTRQITRVYPRGSRVDSSNYMPLLFWNCGCQMAAINLQTPDLPNQVNSAFYEVGICQSLSVMLGYLKVKFFIIQTFVGW